MARMLDIPLPNGKRIRAFSPVWCLVFAALVALICFASSTGNMTADAVLHGYWG